MEGRATHTRRSHLFVRRCVCCGFESRALDDGAACVRCGCDLTERPPKSYAEMEGLVELSSPTPPSSSELSSARWIDEVPLPLAIATESEGSRTIKRWMLFLLLSMLLLITIAALAAAALGA